MAGVLKPIGNKKHDSQTATASHLVYDGAVLQVSQVEHPDRAVRTHTGEHIPSPARLAEGDVVHLLVVCNELSLDVAADTVDPAQELPGLQAPHGARRVDTARPQQVRVNLQYAVNTLHQSSQVD